MRRSVGKFFFGSPRPAGPQPRHGLQLAPPKPFYGWGHRRQRAHGVLASVSADPRRVRVAARAHRRRLLVRVPGLGDSRPGSRPVDRPARAAIRHAARRRDGRRRPRPGSARDGALASLPDARRARRQRHGVPGLHGPRALPAELVRAPPRPRDRYRVLGGQRGLDRHLALDATPDRRPRVAHRVCRDGRARRRRAGALESIDAAAPGRDGALARRRSSSGGHGPCRPASGERRRFRLGVDR